MKLTVIKKIGKREYPFAFEGQNLHECIMESQKLSFPDIFECQLCKSDNLRLNAYVTTKGGFKYTTILCECGAKLTFGQKKDNPDIFYLRRDDKKMFDWKERENEEPPKKEESKTQGAKTYLELLKGNPVLSQDTKDRLEQFLKADKTEMEIESAITSVIELISEAEGTVPERTLPF